MLRCPLIHPPLLAALGAAGHGARVLLADANYSHSTNVSPRAALIHLNLRPGLVTVDQVLEPVLAVCVATGDDRLYANVLLTLGYLTPVS
jgi:L-fucose mutarotase